MDARANCESLQSALGVSVVGKDNPWDVEKPMGIEASRLARSPGGVPTRCPKSALSASTYRRMPMPHRATLPVRSKRGTVPRTTSGIFSALASKTDGVGPYAAGRLTGRQPASASRKDSAVFAIGCDCRTPPHGCSLSVEQVQGLAAKFLAQPELGISLEELGNEKMEWEVVADWPYLV